MVEKLKKLPGKTKPSTLTLKRGKQGSTDAGKKNSFALGELGCWVF